MMREELGVHAWLAAAVADAERRGLGDLAPLLKTLARSTAALRAADTELRTTSDGTVAHKNRKTPPTR
jgi:hypothetical protein